MMTPQMLAMMMVIPSAVLLAFFAVFLLKQHRVQVNKSQLVLDHTGSGTTSSDISDLVTDKSGRSTTVAETKVNTTEALEKLAKEKPTKVAEMLKSTWLSG
jgi:flagellar biosynthesis/type III secretory pathway M-ring protein FliF/YscJ